MVARAHGEAAPMVPAACCLFAWLLLAAGEAATAPEEKKAAESRTAPQEKEAESPTAPQGEAGESPLSLTASQREAVGIRIEHPRPLVRAPTVEAYATVLDPAALVTDFGRVQSTRAAAAAVAAESARLEHLYHDDAQASLRAWQAAQAQSAEAAAQAEAAELTFTLQWGPLAAWESAQQRSLLEALRRGDTLLLRADVPGPYLGGAFGARALVEVSGVNLTARLLGALRRTDSQAQGSGWLLLLEHAPSGFGPGARALVRLQGAETASGLLVPGTALLYAEQGAYVYRQLAATGADSFHYAAAPVKPLGRIGDAWVVEGLARGDEVVVQGAGVLWSLEGVSSFSAAEEEHD
jgi:hypothetical protein